MLFTEFPLHERLQRAITAAGYQEPTPIQAAALPIALAGTDLVGTAQTGTGKTAAFVLPILQGLVTSPRQSRKPRALILTPTRELAEQIHDVIRQLGRHTNLRSATVYGGVGMLQQMRALQNGTEIIVACPGRLLDHVARGNADLSEVEYLVLDEADRMLDMGFMPPIKRIIGLLPIERQTMLFSATFAPELNTFVDQTLRTPERIDIGMAAPADTVEHMLYPVSRHLKPSLLLRILREKSMRSVLIFTRTKHVADRVAEKLTKNGLPAGALHSNKSQSQRQQTLNNFRKGACPFLVATDIAARGIDVAGITHVINYDIPDTVDTYIHRIGRTGRAEQTGEALTMITPEDTGMVRDIEKVLGQRIPKRMVEGFDYSQVKPAEDRTRESARKTARAQIRETEKKRASEKAYAKSAPKTAGKPAKDGRPAPKFAKAAKAEAPRPRKSTPDAARAHRDAGPKVGRSRQTKSRNIARAAHRGAVR